MPVSESKKESRRRWNEEHKAESRVYQYRSKAKKFIREMATDQDLRELEQLIRQQREK